MKNRLFAGLFILLFILVVPIAPVQAESEEIELKRMAVELSAIVDYLTSLVGPIMDTALSEEEMRSVIKGSIGWIMAAQEESGHFAYEYLPYEGVYSDDDNIVRQAGTVYSLAEVVRKDVRERPELNETIERSISYLAELSEQGEYEGEKFSCVIKKMGSNACSLGATSLTLTAILGYVEAYPEKATDYEDLIESYLSFLLITKNPEAGFRQDHLLGSGFRSDKESPFFNGETLLALVRYMQYKNDPEVKQVIDEAFWYLSQKEYETPLYLWIMAALKDMQSLWPNPDYISYGQDFTIERLDSLEFRHKTDRNYCAPLEGVASAYSLLEGQVDDGLEQRIKRELDFWNIKNSYLQIKPEQSLRLYDNGSELEWLSVQDMSLASGGFLTGETELKQRIDFTQHCLNTYLQTLVDIEGKTLR